MLTLRQIMQEANFQDTGSSAGYVMEIDGYTVSLINEEDPPLQITDPETGEVWAFNLDENPKKLV